MSSDHVAALRALAMDVRQESGASAKQRAAMGLLEILRLRRHFVELVYQTEVEKEATAKSRGLLEQVSSVDHREIAYMNAPLIDQ